MKTKARLIALSLLFVSAAAWAQNFTSGSDGSYGPMNIGADTTLDVPTNGIFNCTTINVTINKTLKFRRNLANTPVYLLASGDVSISGRIDVSGGQGNNVVGGIAGPGGFDGGSPGSVSVPPGSGYGPGAGHGGTSGIDAPGAGGASFGTVGQGGQSTNKGTAYANALLIPLVGGSGGGGSAGTPGNGGGGGGGAILVASSTRIDISGYIYANGGASSSGYNGGSGGAVRVVAPIVTGNGQLQVTSPFGCGYGRIRIDAIDRTQMNLTFVDPSVTSVGSLLMVFPTPLPRLDIIEAAGSTITEGALPVVLELPFGSSPNRTIKVQARDFNTQVPITVVLTPDHGTPISYTGTINNAGALNPAALSVDVVLPVNEQVTVNVFSK